MQKPDGLTTFGRSDDINYIYLSIRFLSPSLNSRFNPAKDGQIVRFIHYTGVYRNDRWEYPMIAIREVIRNAVIHRDYSLTGKDIKIAIFDDKIEITSPGKLLPTVDFNDMEAGQSDIRNKILAPVFKRLGIIEQWGNGLRLISQELQKYPEIALEWKEPGIAFRVTFLKKNFISEESAIYTDTSGKTSGKILELIESNKYITIPEISAIIGVTERSIERNIQNLQKGNKLKRVGSAKGGYWEIIKNKEK